MATALGEIVVAGNDYVIVATLTKDGATWNITGATVTCSIRPVGQSANVATDHAVVLTTAASGIVTLTLTDTETALFQVPAAQFPHQTVEHVGDFKVVESGGNVVHSGLFSFQVRRAVT